MARNLHGKDGAAVALKLFLMLVTLLVVGCRSGCDAAANESSMAPEVVSDRGFALLQRPAMEKVAESGDQVLRLELLRRDHPSLANWSSAKPSKSSTVRFLEAVKRSNARRDAIARSMKFATAGPAASSSAEAGWESPPYNNESKLFSIPVSPGEGEFLTRFALGTPAQSFTLILDTGSNLIWAVPCIKLDCRVFCKVRTSHLKP